MTHTQEMTLILRALDTQRKALSLNTDDHQSVRYALNIARLKQCLEKSARAYILNEFENKAKVA